MNHCVVAITPTQNGFPTAESFYQQVFNLGWVEVLAFSAACIGSVVALKIIQSLSGR